MLREDSQDKQSEEDLDGEEDEALEGIGNMTKFYKDLEDIKKRNKATKKEMIGEDGDAKLSKREQKQVKKLLKEKDKLERQALVARMQQRDADQTEKKAGSIVENQSIA